MGEYGTELYFVSVETNGAASVKLSDKDIINLMRLLQSYSYEWNPIGLSLGFTPHELCTISCMVTLLMGAPVSYLQELLSQWVQWPTTEYPNIPTLEALCVALSPLVGLGSLAKDLEKECTGKQVYAGNDVFMHDCTCCKCSWSDN